MRLRSWEGALECNGTPVDISGIPSMGFLEVYESLDALLKEHPGEKDYTEVVEPEPTEKGKTTMAKKKAAKKAKAKKKKSKPMY
jgi:hypothetical protein